MDIEFKENPAQKDPITTEMLQKDNEELLLKYQTALRKAQLIQEIKNGLGEEIKMNKGKIKIIKKPWYKKLGLTLKKFFTKF